MLAHFNSKTAGRYLYLHRPHITQLRPQQHDSGAMHASLAPSFTLHARIPNQSTLGFRRTRSVHKSERLFLPPPVSSACHAGTLKVLRKLCALFEPSQFWHDPVCRQRVGRPPRSQQKQNKSTKLHDEIKCVDKMKAHLLWATR